MTQHTNIKLHCKWKYISVS